MTQPTLMTGPRAALSALPRPWDDRRTRPAELAAALGVATNTASTYLRNLEAAGLAERIRGGAGRGDAWGMTRAGADVLGIRPTLADAAAGVSRSVAGMVEALTAATGEPEEVPAEPAPFGDRATLRSVLGDLDDQGDGNGPRVPPVSVQVVAATVPPIGAVVQVVAPCSPHAGAVGVVTGFGRSIRQAEPTVYVQGPDLPMDTGGRTAGKWFRAVDVSPDLGALAALLDSASWSMFAASGDDPDRLAQAVLTAHGFRRPVPSTSSEPGRDQWWPALLDLDGTPWSAWELVAQTTAGGSEARAIVGAVLESPLEAAARVAVRAWRSDPGGFEAVARAAGRAVAERRTDLDAALGKLDWANGADPGDVMPRGGVSAFEGAARVARFRLSLAEALDAKARELRACGGAQ